MLEEKPLDVVGVYVTDPDKLAAFGFPQIQKNDSDYQLLFLGNNRWELHSTKDQGLGVLVYKNAEWTREGTLSATHETTQPAAVTASSTPMPSSQTAAAGPISHKPFSDEHILFLNSDFDKGDLTNWTASGTAFDFQPTKGDNPTARRRGQPSNHQGDFWIGTYEKYQGVAGQQPGQTQGDEPTGTLISIPFHITEDRIFFLSAAENVLIPFM